MQKLLLHVKRARFAYALFIIIVANAFLAFATSSAQPTIPTRMFDVRNGNGVINAGVTYPQAVVIVFKDKASKDEMIDAFAAQYTYQATIPDPANPSGPQIPNPQTKQAFMNKQITAYLRDVFKAAQAQAATSAAQKTASDAADAKLPPN